MRHPDGATENPRIFLVALISFGDIPRRVCASGGSENHALHFAAFFLSKKKDFFDDKRSFFQSATYIKRNALFFAITYRYFSTVNLSKNHCEKYGRKRSKSTN